MIEGVKIGYDGEKLVVNLPMTQPTGKIRVKTRSFFGEYGNPMATRQELMNQKCYIEWQIGYDMLADRNNIDKTTLSDRTFENYKRETKYAYELSEIIFYSYKLGLIKDIDIEKTYKFIKGIKDNEFIDVIDSMRIMRTNPVETKINQIDFYEMKVSYPLIVHKFGKYDIYTEVINKEKQRGVGVQPMLYVCIPIIELQFDEEPLGRILKPKERGRWIIKEEEAKLALELFEIFGMLSKKHQYDVLAIMRMLFRLD